MFKAMSSKAYMYMKMTNKNPYHCYCNGAEHKQQRGFGWLYCVYFIMLWLMFLNPLHTVMSTVFSSCEERRQLLSAPFCIVSMTVQVGKHISKVELNHQLWFYLRSAKRWPFWENSTWQKVVSTILKSDFLWYISKIKSALSKTM